MSGELKYAGLIACVLISLIVWWLTPRKRDARLQVLTFVFTVAADYFLLFTDLFAAGVIVFWGAHLTALARYRKKWLLAGIILVSAGAALCAAFWASGRSAAILYVACGIYAVLILSVTAATFLYKQGRPGDICSRTGMLLFICCDINVAIFNTAEAGTSLYNVSAPLMWTFYLPAQILLALSALPDKKYPAQVR